MRHTRFVSWPSQHCICLVLLTALGHGILAERSVGKAKDLPTVPKVWEGQLLGSQQQNQGDLFQSEVLPDHVFCFQVQIPSREDLINPIWSKVSILVKPQACWADITVRGPSVGAGPSSGAEEATHKRFT